MEQIQLDDVIPAVFAQSSGLSSQIWHQQLSLSRGKTYLIEADSGTGKSSLCNFIYGSRHDFEGKILFDGHDIRRFSARHWNRIRKDSLGIVFQELALFDELTVIENIQLKNRLTGFKKISEIDLWLDRVGIADKRDTRVSHISFGQRQRVALLRALCQPLDFLILDEPVSHLDAGNTRNLFALLMEETAKQDTGLIITSIGKHPDLTYDQIIRL